jgi:hypothetical protein
LYTKAQNDRLSSPTCKAGCCCGSSISWNVSKQGEKSLEVLIFRYEIWHIFMSTNYEYALYGIVETLCDRHWNAAQNRNPSSCAVSHYFFVFSTNYCHVGFDICQASFLANAVTVVPGITFIFPLWLLYRFLVWCADCLWLLL